MRALLVAVFLVPATLGVAGHGAGAEPPRRDLCARDVRHHGAAIDLDVKGADIHDVFRLIADTGRVNVVISDEVAGKVTLHLVRVPWDAVACAVARLHHLTITVDGNILLILPQR